ncbi:MAG: DEAD/DEAH box helicase [Acidobacteriota bacterium]
MNSVPTGPSTASIHPPISPSTDFASLGLIQPLRRAIEDEGYCTPTPIQCRAIPPVVAGSDLLGCAQTGTGKTAAFALPILQRFSQVRRDAPRRGGRALVLTPTRELALQIAESFRTYGRHLRVSVATVFGGVGQMPQVGALARGVDVVIATPGRLLDLIGQGHARFGSLEMLVLDEADRMLDMGFLPDVRRILATLPANRQTLLFSATMPRAVLDLARGILRDPVEITVAPSATTVEGVTQRVMYVERADKRALLMDVLQDPSMRRALVFTRTKHGANRLARQMGQLPGGVEVIHGNKSQNARQAALSRFKDGRTRVLVATDVAARGLDVDGVTHVVNFEVPSEPESYVHRIGRTARAGAQGIALSLCDSEERASLRDIERVTRKPIEVVADHPYRSRVPHASAAPHARPGAGQHRRGIRRRRRRF